MATRWTEQGLAELNPVYSQERAALENQLPAISQLYQTLVAALEQSGAASQSDILADASRRGINRSTLAAQTSQALAPSLASGLGQLEVDRTGRVADVYGQLSALEQGLAESGIGLGGQLQEQDISRQTQDMKLQELQRGYDIDVRKKQLADAAEARAAEARAAAKGPDIDFADAYLMRRTGKDNKVSPYTYREALASWQELGGKPQVFHTEFRKYVNTSHKDDYYQ